MFPPGCVMAKVTAALNGTGHSKLFCQCLDLEIPSLVSGSEEVPRNG